MKNFVLCFLVLFSATLFAAEPIETDSEIKDVMVYRTGARITRTAPITIPAGQSEVVLTGLTTQCNAHSLQVTMADGIDLISANYRMNFLQNTVIPQELVRFNEEIAALELEVDWLNQQIQVYTSEEQIMTQKQIKLTSDNKGISIADLKEYTAFYRDRTLEIKKSIIDLNTEKKTKQTRISDLRNQVRSLQADKNKKTGEVVLVVQADSPQSCEIDFSYISSQAGWEPIYDLKAKDASSPMDLNLKANIHQSTGVAWDNIQLAVSSGNPFLGNDRPILNPRYISFAPKYITIPEGYNQSGQLDGVNMRQNAFRSNDYLAYKKEKAYDKDDSEYLEEMTADALAKPKLADISDTEITREYNITLKQSIPSNGQRHLVALQNYEIETDYVHHSVPKLDRGAFLIAEVSNWGQYNLLPGTANIFFQNTYIGQSQINSNVTSNKILFSLGRDESIKIKRSKTENLEESSLLGFKTIKNYEYSITVKNTKSKSVSIEVLDQIPISQHEDIVIDLVKTSDADYKEKLGSLMWKLDLAPGESRELVFSYTQKTPSDQSVVIR